MNMLFQQQRSFHLSAAVRSEDAAKAEAAEKPKVKKPRALKDGSEEAASNGTEGAESNPFFSKFFGSEGGAKDETAKAGEADGSASAEPKASSSDASAEQAAKSQAASKLASKSPFLYRTIEGIKDVLAVTFGMERKRDLGAEYDAGLREYPWVWYKDPHTERTMYMNKETGVVTEHKPHDFDQRAAPDAFLETNMEHSSLTVVKDAQGKTAWERTLNAVTNTPIIAQLVAASVAAGQVVADSPVGQMAKSAKQRVDDKIEDAREVWETSQHPLIVNAAYAVDSVMAESEQGRALREIQAIDAGFDQYAFIEEMQTTMIPTVAKAFFTLDMPVLRHWCKDSALAQVRAVAAAREVEGLTMDGTILNVHRTEMFQAKSLERGLPIILVTSQVQYLHCVRNKKGEVTEGSESEIRASMFVFAVTRELDDKTGSLSWKVVEMSMQGSMLYL